MNLTQPKLHNFTPRANAMTIRVHPRLSTPSHSAQKPRLRGPPSKSTKSQNQGVAFAEHDDDDDGGWVGGWWEDYLQK